MTRGSMAARIEQEGTTGARLEAANGHELDNRKARAPRL